LIRLSDSLFFAPQTERFRKKEKRHSKELREKRPNPGPFWFTGFFFSDTRESRAKPELGLEREQSQAGAKAED
jgi:hypothetical protein